MASKGPLKTNLGKKALSLISMTPWAFSREGLADALKSKTPSQKVTLSRVDQILDDLIETGRIKKVNGNGYRAIKPEITPDNIRALIQLNEVPVHQSFLTGHFGNTEPRKIKLLEVLEGLKNESSIEHEKGFFKSKQPAANSAYIRLSRNKEYAHILNWQDKTIPPYIKIPQNLSHQILEENHASNIALARFSRTMSLALTVKSILPTTGIVARFTEISDDIALLEPTDYIHSGTFRVNKTTSPIQPKTGDMVLARHFKKASIHGADMQIDGLMANEECFSGIDLFEHGKNCGIPETVEDEAEKIAMTLPSAYPIKKDKKFKDLTKECFFTVDPANKQDIDDALCFKQNTDGSMTMYVAIANVAAQIPFGSELDKYRRDHPMSVFLANGTHHTMPHSLYNAQNGTLSLCEGHTRHALIHQFTIPANLISLDDIQMEVFPAFIHSRKAFSYEEFAEAMFYPDILEDEQLAISMDNASRFAAQMQFLLGSLPFNSKKLRLTFNSAGEVTDYRYRHCDVSDQVIEFSALLTNRKSTELLLDYNEQHPENPLPLIFRTQDAPDKDDLKEALDRLEKVTPGIVDEQDIDALDDFGRGSDEYAQIARNLIEKALLRCDNDMLNAFVSKTLLQSTRRAVYSIKEQEHFSLDTVTGHFTSPLRRYPDTVHQWSVMKASGIHLPDVSLSQDELSKLAQFASEEEQVSKRIQSNSTQRHLIDYFDKNKEVPITNARIASVREDGVVVDVDGIEGFIPQTELPIDWRIDINAQILKTSEHGCTKIKAIGDTVPLLLSVKEACPFKRSLKFADASQIYGHQNWRQETRAFA